MKIVKVFHKVQNQALICNAIIHEEQFSYYNIRFLFMYIEVFEKIVHIYIEASPIWSSQSIYP